MYVAGTDDISHDRIFSIVIINDKHDAETYCDRQVKVYGYVKATAEYIVSGINAGRYRVRLYV